MSSVCCTHDCRQGRDCPARQTASTATALDADNSDGSSTGHADDELFDDTGLLICQGIALAVFVVSVVAYLLL